MSNINLSNTPASEQGNSLSAQSQLNLENIPQVIKDRAPCCVWRYEYRAPEKKPAKVPYSPKSRHRLDVSKREDFGSFQEAVDVYRQGDYNGIGIAVVGHIVGIDIDHCIDADGNLSPLAQEIIQTINSYTEVSPSGCGIRILCCFDSNFRYDSNLYFSKNADLGLEIYVAGTTTRYVTITGHAVTPCRTLDTRTEQLTAVLDKYMRRSQPSPAGGAEPVPQPTSASTQLTDVDKQIIDQIAQSSSGATFEALMRGDISSYNHDHSSADMALVNMLAARTDDAATIDRIVRSSGLMRPKWDERHGANTYGVTTISKALADMAPYRNQRIPLPKGGFPQLASALQQTSPQQNTPQQTAPQQNTSQQNTSQQTAPQQNTSQQNTSQQNTPQQLIPSALSRLLQAAPPPVVTAPHRRFTAISAQDLMTLSLPPVLFLVDDTLPQGTTLLVADPKLGKSWMALDLGLCLATGQPFLGFATHQCGVLYLALEDNLVRLQDRLAKILNGGIPPQDFRFMTDAPSLNEENENLLEMLDAHLASYPETKLVIIDTLQKVRGICGRKESVYGHDYRELGLLKRYADEHGISLLIIHHTRKAGSDDPFCTINGTNGIMGAVDTTWVIKNQKRNEKAAYLHITGRDVYAQDLLIRFDKSTCRWVYQDQAAADEDMYDTSELVQTVKYLLDASPNRQWSGVATDILIGGQKLGLLNGYSAQKVGLELGKLQDMMEAIDGIVHRTVSINGSGGKKHYFSYKFSVLSASEDQVTEPESEDTHKIENN